MRENESDMKNNGSSSKKYFRTNLMSYKKQGILFQIEDLQNAANGELKGVAYVNSTEKKVNVRLYVSQWIFSYFKLTLLCSR